MQYLAIHTYTQCHSIGWACVCAANLSFVWLFCYFHIRFIRFIRISKVKLLFTTTFNTFVRDSFMVWQVFVVSYSFYWKHAHVYQVISLWLGLIRVGNFDKSADSTNHTNACIFGNLRRNTRTNVDCSLFFFCFANSSNKLNTIFFMPTDSLIVL